MKLEVIMICHENPPQMGLGFHLVHKALVVCNCNKIYVFESHKVEGRCLRSTHLTQPYWPFIWLACFLGIIFLPLTMAKSTTRDHDCEANTLVAFV